MILTPIPHKQATALIAGKPAVTRDVWDALHPDLQARAFTITGVECLDAIARVRELTAQLPSGGDYNELRSQIRSIISPWLVTSDDPEEARKQQLAANRRGEMLLRLHGWQAYAQTQYELAEAHKDVFPYRQYLSSEDSRVRPSHAALNKKILPSDHPFWANHTPPWEFNCRCDMVVMTEEEAKGIAAKETKVTPEDRKVLPPAQLREIERNNRIVKPGGTGYLDLRTPREKNAGKGYEFRPGDNALPLDQILERFTPAERATFKSWAATIKLVDGRTLAEYWAIKGAKKTSIKKTKPIPATQAIAFDDEPTAVEYLKTNLGIDNVEFSAGRARSWGVPIASKEKRLAHMATVASEMERLLLRFPSLKGKLKTLYVIKSERGQAHVDGPSPAMSLKTDEWPDASWAQIEKWEAANNKRFGTERKGSQVRDNFRHELGHTLTTPKALAEFRALAKKEGWNAEWFKQNVSEYAGKKDTESIADSFGLYTREDYKPGTLPASLEAYLENITK